MGSNVTKECTESIYLSGQKKSDSSKLPKLKLAFALKEVFLLAKLACECLGVTRENISLFFTVIQHCTECIRTIQTIGFQVLKNTIQRSTNSGHNSFVLFITGELLEDIFTTIVAMLKSPVNREKVAIASECLRILVIVQTLSKVHESRKSLMNLLLQAIVFIFSVTDDLSQEMNELRKTAGHLISQLAQVPSSVVFLKDALLAMPVENRQQLQGIIRASVPQEHPATETKSPTPSLVIKLPIQTEETGDQDLAKSIPAKNSDFRSEEESKKDEVEGGGGEEEEEEDDDDDWDTFQSFPASTSELVATANAEADVEEPEIIEKSSTSDIYTGNLDVEENADSYTPKHLEEEEEDADKKSSVVRTASDDDETNQKEEPHVSPDEISKAEKSDDDRHDEKSQEAVTGEIDLVIPKHQSGDSAETNQKEKPRVSQDEISEAEKSDGDRHYEKSQEAVTGEIDLVIPKHQSGDSDESNQKEEAHVSQDEISEAEKSDGDRHDEKGQEAVTGEIDLVVPKHQSDDSLEQIQTVHGGGYHGTDERVTSDNDSVDVALSNDADQPSLVRESQNTGTEDISPESSGDLHREATSDKEQPKETDDDVKHETESNAEQV